MKIITIGRDQSNIVVLKDPTGSTSRRHAEIRYKAEGQLVIVDKSANGTSVNGRRITSNQEYYIYRGDAIRFANKVDLDWEQVPVKAPTRTVFQTNFIRDIRQVFEQILDFNTLSKLLKEFWKLLKGGSTRIFELVSNPHSALTGHLSFYIIGLTFFVIVFNKSIPLMSLEPKNPGNLHLLIENWGPIGEFGGILLLSFFTFSGAILNYKIFKWITNSERHWAQYLRMFCYTFGMYFWLITIIFLPGMLVWMSIGGGSDNIPGWLHVLSTFIKTSVALLSIITFLVWVRVNMRFWE